MSMCPRTNVKKPEDVFCRDMGGCRMDIASSTQLPRKSFTAGTSSSMNMKQGSKPWKTSNPYHT
jgi:hypothetical protein